MAESFPLFMSLPTRKMIDANTDLKERVRAFWQAHPCGTKFSDAEIGTREFFARIEAHRYAKEWHIPEAADFAGARGLRVLEIGCGLGTDGAQFAKAGADYTGVDLTDAAVELAGRHFELLGLHGDFRTADAEDLDFADNTFDLVYSHGVLHHTPDTAGAVREIHRVLKPGGRAMVMLYHRGSWAYWTQVVLRYGILRGEFLRGTSANDIMSKYVEFNAGGGRPLVKAYSRREARNLFSMFREVKTDVEQLLRAEFYFLSGLVPESVFRKLRTTLGWNVIISAKK